MIDPDERLWLAFEALTKAYPYDEGVRVTRDLGRRLLEESDRLHVATPQTMQKVLRVSVQRVPASTSRVCQRGHIKTDHDYVDGVGRSCLYSACGCAAFEAASRPANGE